MKQQFAKEGEFSPNEDGELDQEEEEEEGSDDDNF
jgi:hypothetical protein